MKRSEFFKSLATVVVAPFAFAKGLAGGPAPIANTNQKVFHRDSSVDWDTFKKRINFETGKVEVR